MDIRYFLEEGRDFLIDSFSFKAGYEIKMFRKHWPDEKLLFY